MSGAGAAKVSAGVAARVKALAPYLESMFESGGDQVWRLGTTELSLNQWERSQIVLVSRRHGVVESSDGSHLVAQGSALFAKCAGDVAELIRAVGTTDEFQRCQAALMLDAAIGGALLADTQSMVDRHVAAGRIDEARHLTEFIRKLRRAVAEARKGVSESEQAWVQDVARRLSEAVDAAAPAPRPAAPPVFRSAGDHEVVMAPPRDRPARRRPRRRRADDGSSSGRRFRGPSPLAVTATIFLALVATWGVLVAPRILRGPGVRPPSAGTLPYGDVVTRVVSRSQSLFVEVDPREWGRLTDENRTRFARGLAGSVVGRYRGAIVRTPDGRVLLTWYAGEGLRPVGPPPEPPTPTADTATPTPAATP